jgi:sugar lactone lactonase YvrE
MREAEQFTLPCAHHGEGPYWDSHSNRLLCVDVLAGAVVAIDSAGDVRRYPVPSRAATVIRRRASTGFIIATEHGVMVADEGLTTFEDFAELVNDPGLRTNDGGCDPLGAFVVGTMSYQEEAGRGAVFRVAPDGQIAEVLLAPVSISNGVQWSADGERVFYIDTPTRRVDAFDFETRTGAWTGRRTHVCIENPGGFPDGMAIDEEDGLWVAIWGAGAVNHYDKDGRLVETVTVPGVTQVSSCTFGGDDRSVLYITTSRQDLAAGQEPAAGAIFSLQTSVRGAIPAEFAG